MTKPQARLSIYGFYCDDCKKFVYMGYDNRDIPEKHNAVCVECGEQYF